MRAILAALIVCLFAAPSFAVDKHKATLIVTIVMPRQMPDLRQQIPEDSLDECWIDAKEFVNRGVPKQVEGGLAVMGACLATKIDEDDL